MDIKIKPVEQIIALDLILNNHYRKVMPRLTKYCLGGFVEDKLIGCITLGWGTRPSHTIKKLFPSLSTKDYFEIGRMAMLEEMPKNTESQFLSAVIQWIKKNEPEVKLLFTWADGTLGKPGYVYQAANFLYGGFIWTDIYVTKEGEAVHPRTSQGLTDKKDKTCGFRPTRKFLKENGWHHYKGKQFKYIYFLCNRVEKRKLLTNTTVRWTIEYPKGDALEWSEQDFDTGEWDRVSKIFYDQTITTKANKTAVINKEKVKSLGISRQFFEF